MNGARTVPRTMAVRAPHMTVRRDPRGSRRTVMNAPAQSRGSSASPSSGLPFDVMPMKRYSGRGLAQM
ncbi:hypothetical protein GA0115246_110072 [Streptomyces sp. SolWspMP-sol7th]|nr:hypothetical protein GA0115246_110072 [Streptomyces sp. SolWspMP-sol7th]